MSGRLEVDKEHDIITAYTYGINGEGVEGENHHYWYLVGDKYGCTWWCDITDLDSGAENMIAHIKNLPKCKYTGYCYGTDRPIFEYR